ncbi:MAG: ATP-binding cassette domain-containing protein [Coriobacteriales bacterium]|jgi:energy-coupling factor transport system ATP-binding protein|nr:ATP-binding cassette domain-containing protein [Coriobacteriales bacterium]
MALVEVEDLSFAYPGAAAPALKHVSLSLERGAFVLLCGRSGCGKTTLLRQLKTPLVPAGHIRGHVRYDGRTLSEVDLREQAARIGFVMQNPESQLVTDTVYHELAFGLESLGMPQQEIRLRVAEMASFFGIGEWFHKKVTELSGGQKQLLNLASVMALQPELLVLDEPTSQLDPIAASEFLAMVKKINTELGVTVLLTEHRLEEAMPLAEHVVVMDAGRVIAAGVPGEVGLALAAASHPLLAALPTPMRVALTVEGVGADDTIPEGDSIASKAGAKAFCTDGKIRETASNTPVTIREGRRWLARQLEGGRLKERDDVAGSSADGTVSHGEGFLANRAAALTNETGFLSDETAPLPGNTPPVVISARDLWFRYDRNGEDVLRGLSLEVRAGEFFCVVGGNGTGKSTALGILSGLLRPYRGKLRVAGIDPSRASRAALAELGLVALPQDQQTLFVHNTVLEDLAAAAPPGAAEDGRLARAIEQTETGHILSQHPYDISCGEQQRVALAMALLAEPRILLLDEPTKGMDAFYKRRFADILTRLREQGLTVVMVSHDVEFCAEHATRCALLFDGGIVAEGAPRPFFSHNSFYTTAANRMGRGLVEGAVTADDLIAALGGPVQLPPTGAATAGSMATTQDTATRDSVAQGRTRAGGSSC